MLKRLKAFLWYEECELKVLLGRRVFIKRQGASFLQWFWLWISQLKGGTATRTENISLKKNKNKKTYNCMGFTDNTMKHGVCNCLLIAWCMGKSVVCVCVCVGGKRLMGLPSRSVRSKSVSSHGKAKSASASHYRQLSRRVCVCVRQMGVVWPVWLNANGQVLTGIVW